MSVDRLNWTNIGLMIAALSLAIVAPFHLFLLAYAILGPLHYLTEVSWLKDRAFFTSRPSHRTAWLVLVAATTAVMAVAYVSSDLLGRPIRPTLEIGMFLLVFFGAAVAVYVRHPVNALVVITAAALALVSVSGHAAYGITAYLLVTIVHVFLFTGAFILVGATKSRSWSGYLSAVVFFGCAVVSLLPIASIVVPGDRARAVYATFEQLNLVLMRLRGSPSGDVYGAAGIGVMRFIAFAYTYHYLNWFSKTSIIRWHEVPRARLVAIVGAWLAGIGLYLYDYRLGFAASYVLSVIHVMLEFPLNHQTFVSLARSLAPAAAYNRAHVPPGRNYEGNHPAKLAEVRRPEPDRRAASLGNGRAARGRP